MIAAFGADAAAGQQHYVSFGKARGALETFDETQYLTNYADLQAAFGRNGDPATQHFIQFGFGEGRNDCMIVNQRNGPTESALAVDHHFGRRQIGCVGRSLLILSNDPADNGVRAPSPA